MPVLTPTLALLLAAATGAVGYGLAAWAARSRLQAARKALGEAEARASQARETAAAALAAKDRFLSALNHEARTPLNGVVGTAALVLGQSVTPEVRQAAEAIRASSDALLTTLDDLLDLSRLEAGQWQAREEVFSPAHCLNEVIPVLSEQARTLGKRCTSEVRANVPAWAKGDPARLRQVLLQVAGHVLTHSPRSEVSVAMSARPLDEVSTELTIAVSDHGDIAEKVPKTRLYEALERSLKPDDRAVAGADVGLAISRLVCERLGGRVQVQSDSSSGTTVHLSMNLGAATAPVPAPAPASGPIAPCAILLVEDNPVNMKVAVGMLGQMGCKPDLAANGKEALEAVAKKAYDVILMDIQMPVMNGLEATQQIAAGAHVGPRPWIIAVTANTMPGDRDLCLKTGMNDYVAKPLKSAVLRAAMERGLSARGA